MAIDLIELCGFDAAKLIADCIISQAGISVIDFPHEEYRYELQALDINVDRIRIVADGEEFLLRAKQLAPDKIPICKKGGPLVGGP